MQSVEIERIEPLVVKGPDAGRTVRFKRVPYSYRVSGWGYSDIDEERVVTSLFDVEEIARFGTDGFLLVEKAIDGAQLQDLRDGLDSLRQRTCGNSIESNNPEFSHFQGQYLLNPAFEDERLARLLEPEPIVGSMRSLLGPAVMLRTGCGRVTFPGTARTETQWHVDYRINVEPAPPLLAAQPLVACVVYLDDVTMDSGPTYLVPGSHRWSQLPPRTDGALPGAVALCPKAGSLLFFHGSLWHRGGANVATGALRRVIILHFGAAGGRRQDDQAKVPPPTPRLEADLVARARAAQDGPMLEVLGQVWY